VSAGQSDTGMEFAAKYADYNFILGSGVNTPAAFAPLNTQLLAAAAKTGRDVGAYVLFMVIADETDDAAIAKWLRYKEATMTSSARSSSQMFSVAAAPQLPKITRSDDPPAVGASSPGSPREKQVFCHLR
jgi:alkanesulfonate monooxygenase SsuD/methylene tetrahydromethanopterin reductase-like flavin-dependent oxidoreductase (luciferase family)